MSNVPRNFSVSRVTLPSFPVWTKLTRGIAFCEENLSVVSFAASVAIKLVFIGTLWWKLSGVALGVFSVALLLLVILEFAFTVAALVTAKLREDEKGLYARHIEFFKWSGVVFNEAMIFLTISAVELAVLEAWTFGVIMTMANAASYFMAEAAGYLNHKQATYALSQGSQTALPKQSQGSQGKKSQKSQGKDVFLTIDGNTYTEMQVNSQITTNFSRLREAARQGDYERVGVLRRKIETICKALEQQRGEATDKILLRMERDSKMQ